MNEPIEIIKIAFSNYFANGRYFVIVLVAILILMLEEKRKENRNFLIYYPVLMFVIVCNPIFAKVLLKFITTNVYYRFFWTIPIGIIMAYFGTTLVFRVDKKISKIVISLLLIGMIVYSGNFVYTKTTFQKVDNWYKLPDSYVEVIQLVGQIPLENKKMITSPDMIGYVRQLDASIKLGFQRRLHGDYEETYEMVRYYKAGDVENLTNLCKSQEINIIVYDNSIKLTISPVYFGYNLYAQTPNYDIYVLAENSNDNKANLSNLEIDEETIKIDNLKDSYQICFLNDLHIIVPDDEVSQENKETLMQRYQAFKSPDGQYTSEFWEELSQKINSLDSDLVVLGGDIIDYISKSNVEVLKKGMKNINKDILYLRADHDCSKVYNKQLNQEYINDLQTSITDNAPILYRDLGEILVVGINNSTNQLTIEALNKLEEIFAIGKPIILVTHVPFNSRINSGLAEESKKIWNGRNLTWDSQGTSYTANENTQKFLEMIHDDNTPVKAVLAGHLHFKYTEKLNKNVIQYIFDASYHNKIGFINITGK